MTCAAKTTGIEREEIISEAGLTLLSGKSLKASLDIDWDDVQAKHEALQKLLAEVDAVEEWLATHARDEMDKPPLKEAVQTLRKVLEQDLEPDPSRGGRRIKRGVAKDRMPSLGDREMRHGRKSKSKKFSGYKRYALQTRPGGIVMSACAAPANRAEHEVGDEMLVEAESQGPLQGIDIDRGFLSASKVVQFYNEGKEVNCKPWPSRNRGLFTKEDFEIRLQDYTVMCPAGTITSISTKTRVARFPKSACSECKLRSQCTRAKEGRGRSVSVHQQEAMLIDFRQRKKTEQGRQKLRERVTIEHKLARIGSIQGNKARYKGTRKNTFDVRRAAVVANLQTIARHQEHQLQVAV